MKLYTYFRAAEIAGKRVDRLIDYQGYVGIHNANDYIRLMSQYGNLRDGLIKRMERVEDELRRYKNPVLALPENEG